MKRLGLALAALVFVPLGATAPLPGATADMDLVCTWSPQLSNVTAAANDDQPLDVPLGTTGVAPASNLGPLAVYFGLSTPFHGLAVDVGLPGLGSPAGAGALQWEYSSDQGWRSLGVDDASADFHNLGTHSILFTPPPDWSPATFPAPCQGTFFLIVAMNDAPYTSPPMGNQVSAILEESL
jgi:hypothetical protein